MPAPARWSELTISIMAASLEPTESMTTEAGMAIDYLGCKII